MIGAEEAPNIQGICENKTLFRRMEMICPIPNDKKLIFVKVAETGGILMCED